MADNQSVTCNWCNGETEIIWVHGHGQCAVCGINIDECCRGEAADYESPLPNDNKKNIIEND